jgi:hypothetical protein
MCPLDIGEKIKRPTAAAFREIVSRFEIALEVLRGKERRWEVSAQRAKPVAPLIRYHTR